MSGMLRDLQKSLDVISKENAYLKEQATVIKEAFSLFLTTLPANFGKDFIPILKKLIKEFGEIGTEHRKDLITSDNELTTSATVQFQESSTPKASIKPNRILSRSPDKEVQKLRKINKKLEEELSIFKLRGELSGLSTESNTPSMYRSVMEPDQTDRIYQLEIQNTELKRSL